MINFKPKSFHLQWHLTERCNLNCLHCYKEKKFLKGELHFFQVKKIFFEFLKLIKEWQLNRENVRVSFTGGEPFVREDFFEILELASKKRKNIRFGILTNGTLLNENIIKKLEDLKLDYLQISIEGGEKINDQIRGKGTFKKIIKALKILKKTKIFVGLSMTVTKINLSEIEKVIKIAKKFKVALGVRRQVPIGFGKKLSKFSLSPKEVQKMYHYLFWLKKDYDLIFFGCEDGILAQDFPEYFPNGCSAGYLSMTILPNGDVYPCRRLPIFSGNLKNSSLKEIYYFSKVFRKLRNLNQINKVCHQCPFFEICLGGGKCQAFGYFGKIEAPDPHCWRIFKNLPSKNLKWKSFSKKEKLNEELIDFF